MIWSDVMWSEGVILQIFYSALACGLKKSICKSHLVVYNMYVFIVVYDTLNCNIDWDLLSSDITRYQLYVAGAH